MILLDFKSNPSGRVRPRLPAGRLGSAAPWPRPSAEGRSRTGGNPPRGLPRICVRCWGPRSRSLFYDRLGASSSRQLLAGPWDQAQPTCSQPSTRPESAHARRPRTVISPESPSDVIEQRPQGDAQGPGVCVGRGRCGRCGDVGSCRGPGLLRALQVPCPSAVGGGARESHSRPGIRPPANPRDGSRTFRVYLRASWPRRHARLPKT